MLNRSLGVIGTRQWSLTGMSLLSAFLLFSGPAFGDHEDEAVVAGTGATTERRADPGDIKSIWATNCKSCHKWSDPKGDKHHVFDQYGNPKKEKIAEIVRRVNLPKSDDEHMPTDVDLKDADKKTIADWAAANK